MTDKYQSRHTGILRSVQFDRDNYEGREYVKVVGRFEVISSADPNNDLVGQHVTWWGSLSQDVTRGKTGKRFEEFTIESLRACGWTGTSMRELPALAEANELATEVSLTVEHENKQNRDTGEWKWWATVIFVNPVGGGKVKLRNELAGDELDRFSKQMEARIANLSGGNRQPAQTRSAAPPQHRTSYAGNGNGNGGSRGGNWDDRPSPSRNGPDDDIPF